MFTLVKTVIQVLRNWGRLETHSNNLRAKPLFAPSVVIQPDQAEGSGAKITGNLFDDLS